MQCINNGDEVMRYTLKKKYERPFLHLRNSIIIEVNNEFINFTGYSRNELIGKSLYEINSMLRLNSQICLENIQDECSCYMFTRSYEPREVTILCKTLECENEKMYFFKEKVNSRIQDKFMYVEQLYADNQIGISMHSFPDLILLRANQKQLDFLDPPYNKKENSIGRKLKEIVTGYEGSNEEEVWSNIIKNGKTYYAEEGKYDYFKRGVTYWDISIVPIYIEGKAKYIVQTTKEVTEKVLNRKVVEEQTKVIKQQKDELEVIIENMSDGLCIIDKDYNYSLLNSSGREFIYNPDSMKKVGDTLIHTKYYDSEGNLLQYEYLPVVRVLKGEKIKEFRITHNRPDGIYHFSASGSPIYDKNGNIEKAVICFRDITEQVKKDELIRAQNKQLKAILENMSDALLIFDKNGNYTTFNKSARDIFLIQSTKVNKIGDSLEKYKFFDVNKQIITCENLPAKRVIKGEKLLGYRLSKKTDDGFNYFDVNGTPVYDNEGNFIAGILCCRDITEKIKHEEDVLIKAQYDFLRSMIDNIDLPVIRLSYPDFKIIEINQKSYNFVKLSRQEIKSISSVKGKRYSDIISDFDKNDALKHIQDIRDKKKISYIKYKRLVVCGEEMFVNILYQPLFGLDGEVVEVVEIVIDVTEEIKANHHIEKVLKIQEEFLANISHELKTPLNVIFSTTQLFDLYLKKDSLINNKDKMSKYIDTMRQNCYRLLKLISNIVDLSKVESGFFELNMSNENIISVVEDTVQSVSEYVQSKELSIIFDTDTEEKIIACDPNKIERIILNLISNAIKFSNPGNEIYVKILNKNDVVEISVKDSGIGIDKKYMDTIFEKFRQVDKSFTRNAEGSGIGLCLVKSIVELHGGKISVESKLGEGSKFKIELPSRTIANSSNIHQNKPQNKNVEMINVEFSDIYA